MTLTLLSNEQLLKFIRAKSRTGAEALYDQYAAVLRLAIFRIVRQRELTDTVLEKTMCEIWNTAGLYNEQAGPLLPWMMAIAKSLAQECTALPIEKISA